MNNLKQFSTPISINRMKNDLYEYIIQIIGSITGMDMLP